MAGNLGRSTDPLTHYGREIVFEERTSDPASTSEGDMWLRVDLAPEANQLATLRFEHGSGTWDIPVFDTGTSQEGVEEVFRIPISGQNGYVPGAARDDAAFSQLSFSHTGATYGFHNDIELGAIPDSVTYQNIVTQYTYEDDSDTTTAVDTVGTNNATIAGATYTSESVEGDLALLHDGGDDESESDSAVDLYTPGDPGYGIGAFVKFSSEGDRGIISHEQGSFDYLYISVRDGEFRSGLTVSNTTNTITGGSVVSGQWYHVYTEVTDTTHYFYLDGSLLKSQSHGFDIEGGEGVHITGRSLIGDSHLDGIVDEFTLVADTIN